jgi:S1-C subfamily serine protease
VSDDDFFDDEVAGFGEPLHPDDRIWRHPSELHKVPPPGARSIPDIVDFAPVPRRRRSWVALAASGAVGAAMAVSVILATGVTERVVTRWIEPPEMFPFVLSGRAVGSGSTTTVPVVATTTTTTDVRGGVDELAGGPSLTEVAELAAPSLVWISVVGEDGTTDCTGIVLSADGHVLTESRPFETAGEITVRFHDGTASSGRLVGIDPLTEVAVLKVDRTDLSPARLGDPRSLKVGATVLVLGPDETGRTMASAAMVNAVGTTARRRDAITLYDVIQFDAILPANLSGGPLLNDAGEVVGLTVRAGTGEPFTLATPIDSARAVAADLITEGRPRHPWLGVEGRQEDARPVVMRVVEGSPAHAAGLAPDDVILAVDGEPVHSMAAFVTAVRARRPGDAITITYSRDGEEWDCVAILGVRDPALDLPALGGSDGSEE